jgi:prolyl 4-hydroxylase
LFCFPCNIQQPPEHFEPAQVTHYKFGQLYAAHYDAFDVTNAPGLECAAQGGQRVATVLIYLNDVSSGGGTYFPKLDLRVQPKLGKAVIFFPCSLNGQLDPLALHTAEPAVEEKWVCQVWIRQTDFLKRVL